MPRLSFELQCFQKDWKSIFAVYKLKMTLVYDPTETLKQQKKCSNLCTHVIEKLMTSVCAVIPIGVFCNFHFKFSHWEKQCVPSDLYKNQTHTCNCVKTNYQNQLKENAKYLIIQVFFLSLLLTKTTAVNVEQKHIRMKSYSIKSHIWAHFWTLKPAAGHEVSHGLLQSRSKLNGQDFI